MSDRDRCASEQTALAETDIIEMGAHSLPREYLLSLSTCCPRPGIGSPRSGPFLGYTRPAHAKESCALWTLAYGASWRKRG